MVKVVQTANTIGDSLSTSEKVEFSFHGGKREIKSVSAPRILQGGNPRGSTTVAGEKTHSKKKS